MSKLVKTLERRECIDSNSVRKLCIEQKWFTCGTNSEYERLFSMCQKYDGKLNDLNSIALYILNKSDYDCFDIYDTVEEASCHIMRLIILDCTYNIIEYNMQEV